MSGMKSWSTVAANNVLANTGFTMDEAMPPSSVNDSVRQLMADVRTEWAQGANIASAATVDLSTATGGYVHITGTVTITSFGTVSAGIRRKITFDGALTLTHNGTSLILPTGGNIITVAGDTCEAMSEGSGNWRVLWYAGKNVQATNVTASTMVTTPLVTTGGALILQNTADAQMSFQINSATKWAITSTNFRFIPGTDNALNIGDPALRVANVFTPIVDTGTTGSGALKTNNGTTVLTWANDLSVKPVGLLDLTTGTAGQISFPAAQNASAGANVLDDYEEGTWTPSVGGSATYTAQTGTYTKIGRLVFLRGFIAISSIGSGSATTISGIPFLQAINTAGCVSNFSTLAASPVFISCLITGSSTIVFPGLTAAGGSTSNLAILGNNATIDFSVTYQV